MKRFATVCSGIGAPEVAAAPLGWRCVFSSDIEPFPNAVRAHHWPDVPNLGDMTKFKEWKDYAIDVLIGGTPCQAFSVAGLRKGLADPRGNLTLVFLGIIDKYRPKWVLWENVPGVLSVDEGKTFGAFLGGLGQLGYGFAYRVLDAQYFGVAQRRRRVFVVGHIGGQWQRAAAVLFERESLRGDSAPSRKAGKGFTTSTKDGLANSLGAHGGSGYRQDLDNETYVSPTINSADSGSNRTKTLMHGMAVRRLTPRECERLQGFPDDFTLINFRNKPAADGPRYKALGNSMAVPNIRWILQRMDMVDAL